MTHFIHRLRRHMFEREPDRMVMVSMQHCGTAETRQAEAANRCLRARIGLSIETPYVE